MDALLEKVRNIYPQLQNGQKEVISEVVNALKNQARQIDELHSPIPEAPASATVKVVEKSTQLEWLVTVRQVGQGLALIQMLPDVGNALLDNGFIAFDAYVDQRRAERETSRGNGAGPAQLPPLPANASQPAASQLQDEFSAQTLVISVNKGKPYYKVQGGKFTQYGVTVWPEVLQAAGYDVNALDPMQTYSLTGYAAVYVCKDDGKPDKVVELRRD